MATASTVNVACKLPQGLGLSHKGKQIHLHGANQSGNRFGFGITKGVDADWFKEWIEGDGAELPFVKNKSLFAMPGDENKIKDAAAERRADDSVQTGLEPLDPSKPGKDVEPTDDKQLVYGAILVTFCFLRPRGLIGGRGGAE